MEVDDDNQELSSKKKHRELFNPNVNVMFAEEDYGDEDDYGQEDYDSDEVAQENVFN